MPVYRIGRYKLTFPNWPITIPENTIDDIHTDLYLVGQNKLLWGSYLNRNFVYLLEHFAGQTPPTKPIHGQLWYDVVSDLLKYYDEYVNVWKYVEVEISPVEKFPTQGNYGDQYILYSDTSRKYHYHDGIEWVPILVYEIQDSTSFTPVKGTIWLDRDDELLYIYDGTQWNSLFFSGISISANPVNFVALETNSNISVSAPHEHLGITPDNRIEIRIVRISSNNPVTVTFPDTDRTSFYRFHIPRTMNHPVMLSFPSAESLDRPDTNIVVSGFFEVVDRDIDRFVDVFVPYPGKVLARGDIYERKRTIRSGKHIFEKNLKMEENVVHFDDQYTENNFSIGRDLVVNSAVVVNLNATINQSATVMGDDRTYNLFVSGGFTTRGLGRHRYPVVQAISSDFVIDDNWRGCVVVYFGNTNTNFFVDENNITKDCEIIVVNNSNWTVSIDVSGFTGATYLPPRTPTEFTVMYLRTCEIGGGMKTIIFKEKYDIMS